MRTVILIALLCAPALAFAEAADAGSAPAQPESTAGADGGSIRAPSPEQSDGEGGGRGEQSDGGSKSATETAPTKTLGEKDLVEKDDYRVRLSLPTEDDRTAWASPGLRVELAVEEGYLAAIGPSTHLWGTTVHLRLRLRMDRWWSVAGTVGYTVSRGDYYGNRWTAVLEPTFHPLPSMGLSLALGYGGLSVALPANRQPSVADESVSRNLGPDEKMGSCTGSAFVGQVRLEYLFVVGPMWSTGPYLVGDSQWTSCTESFGRTDRASGMPVSGTQWWLNLGGALGWWLSWR